VPLNARPPSMQPGVFFHQAATLIVPSRLSTMTGA
jgi:hypothetical protein